MSHRRISYLHVIATVQPIAIIVDYDQNLWINYVRNLSLRSAAAAAGETLVLRANKVTLKVGQIGGSSSAKPLLQAIWFHECCEGIYRVL